MAKKKTKKKASKVETPLVLRVRFELLLKGDRDLGAYRYHTFFKSERAATELGKLLTVDTRLTYKVKRVQTVFVGS